MSELKLDSLIERVTVLRRNPDTGEIYRSCIIRNDGKKKKGSKFLRPMEKLIRRLGKAQERSAIIYSARHERSKRKRKNGWLYDMVANVRKAQGQAWKSVRK